MAIVQTQNTPSSLPEAYDETYLRVLMRDPGRLFAFWEFSAGTLRTAAQAAGKNGSGFRSILRLFMLDSAPHDRGLSVADFPLAEGERSRYIPVPQQGRSYRLECGFATRSGSFFPLCSSNIVLTPDATVHPYGPGPGIVAGQPTAGISGGHPDDAPGRGASAGDTRPRHDSSLVPSDELLHLMGGSAQGIPSREPGTSAADRRTPVW